MSGRPQGKQWKRVYDERQRTAAAALPSLRALEASLAMEVGTAALATVRDAIDLCEFWCDGVVDAAAAQGLPAAGNSGIIVHKE